MIDGLLEALGAVGYALDTPGASLRGALIGRPGDRDSGREMLEALGYGANQEGLHYSRSRQLLQAEPNTVDSRR